MGVPRKSAKAAKTGLDARPGPKLWERPSDCFKELRAAPGWLPRTPAGARVPMLSRCQRCQIPEIDYFAGLYGAAPVPIHPWRGLGNARRANFARAILFNSIRVPNDSRGRRCAKRRHPHAEDAFPWRAPDDQCARWSTTPGLRGRAAPKLPHPVQRHRQRHQDLTKSCAWTPSSRPKSCAASSPS